MRVFQQRIRQRHDLDSEQDSRHEWRSQLLRRHSLRGAEHEADNYRLSRNNPDFNYAVAGVVTRWTPVKNLSFSAELAYTMLDQKYASGSTVNLPLQSGIAKPGAAYELKDQNSLTLLFRTQRNW